MDPERTLNLVFPGPFRRAKPYRATVRDIAQRVIQKEYERLVKAGRLEEPWFPTPFVRVRSRGMNTLNARTDVRALVNMLRGVVFTVHATLVAIEYSEKLPDQFIHLAFEIEER